MLHAEQQLARIEAASVPHMSRDGHRDTIRRLTDRLRRTSGPRERATAATTADLSMLGIRVEQVKGDSQ